MFGVEKRLSLWVYVFVLLAAFLLVVSGAQIAFLNYIENRINDEISSKTTFLTNKAIEIAVSDQFNDIDTLLKRFDENTKDLTNTAPKPLIAKRYQVISEEQTELIALDKTQNAENLTTITSAINEIHKRIGDIKVAPGKNNVFIFSSPQSGTSTPLIAESTLMLTSEDSTISEYFRYLTMGTLLTALLSLLYAFWLARHVTQPLSKLSLGFKRLAKGDIGFELPVTGVKEVRQTLSQFNQTSTRLKQLQEKEYEFQKRAHLAELGEVSRGIAHSLRNPLNTIGLALEEISQQDISEEQQQVIAQQAREKIEALDKTIKSLLLLTTKVNRDKKVSLNQLFEEIALQASMSGKCKINLRATQRVDIDGSEPELFAVISSLVSNAKEASVQPCEITIELSVIEDQALINIIDSGKGLSKSIVSDLFQPHVTTKAEGAGMGLYIAKRIIQLHYSGDITLKDNLQKGCTATVILPLIGNRSDA